MSKESELQAYRNAILAERYRALRDGWDVDLLVCRWIDTGRHNYWEPITGKNLDDALDEVIRLRNQEAGLDDKLTAELPIPEPVEVEAKVEVPR